MRYLKNIWKHSENIKILREKRREKKLLYFSAFLIDFTSYRKYNVGIGGIRAEMKKMGRPKSDNAKKKVLSIRVPDQLYSQMLAYAEQHKMTTTDIVLKGVEILLSEQKNSECFSLRGGNYYGESQKRFARKIFTQRRSTKIIR